MSRWSTTVRLLLAFLLTPLLAALVFGLGQLWEARDGAAFLGGS